MTDAVAPSAADRPPLSRRGSGVVKRDVLDWANKVASDPRFVTALLTKLSHIRSSAAKRRGRSRDTAAAPGGCMAVGECDDGFSCSGSTATPMHALSDEHNPKISPRRGKTSVSPEMLAATGRGQEASRKKGESTPSSVPFAGECNKRLARKREPAENASLLNWGCALNSKPAVHEQSPHASYQKERHSRPATQGR